VSRKPSGFFKYARTVCCPRARSPAPVRTLFASPPVGCWGSLAFSMPMNTLRPLTRVLECGPFFAVFFQKGTTPPPLGPLNVIGGEPQRQVLKANIFCVFALQDLFSFSSKKFTLLSFFGSQAPTPPPPWSLGSGSATGCRPSGESPTRSSPSGLGFFRMFRPEENTPAHSRPEKTLLAVFSVHTTPPPPPPPHPKT